MDEASSKHGDIVSGAVLFGLGVFQFEDGFMKGAELSKFYDEFFNRMRDILKEGGIKVVR